MFNRLCTGVNLKTNTHACSRLSSAFVVLTFLSFIRTQGLFSNSFILMESEVIYFMYREGI